MQLLYRLFGAMLLSCFMFTSPAAAQDSSYVAKNNRPSGTQLAVVYIGAESCGPCHLPENKQAVKEMKMAFSKVARERGWSFKVVGVALDWSTQVGYEFLRDNGEFDEMIVGNNWTNLAAEEYIWRPDDVRAAIPQVVLYKQDVEPGQTAIEFGERYDVKPLSMEELREWLEEGASWEALTTPAE